MGPDNAVAICTILTNTITKFRNNNLVTNLPVISQVILIN